MSYVVYDTDEGCNEAYRNSIHFRIELHDAFATCLLGRLPVTIGREPFDLDVIYKTIRVCSEASTVRGVGTFLPSDVVH